MNADLRREKKIRVVAEKGENKRCIECDAYGPTYVNTSNQSFVCVSCSYLLINIGQRIKSVSMAKFTDQEVKMLEKTGGNHQCKRIYTAKMINPASIIPATSDTQAFQSYLHKKYVLNTWKDESLFTSITNGSLNTSDDLKAADNNNRGFLNKSPSLGLSASGSNISRRRSRKIPRENSGVGVSSNGSSSGSILSTLNGPKSSYNLNPNPTPNPSLDNVSTTRALCNGTIGASLISSPSNNSSYNCNSGSMTMVSGAEQFNNSSSVIGNHNPFSSKPGDNNINSVSFSRVAKNYMQSDFNSDTNISVAAAGNPFHNVNNNQPKIDITSIPVVIGDPACISTPTLASTHNPFFDADPSPVPIHTQNNTSPFSYGSNFNNQTRPKPLHTSATTTTQGNKKTTTSRNLLKPQIINPTQQQKLQMQNDRYDLLKDFDTSVPSSIFSPIQSPTPISKHEHSNASPFGAYESIPFNQDMPVSYQNSNLDPNNNFGLSSINNNNESISSSSNPFTPSSMSSEPVSNSNGNGNPFMVSQANSNPNFSQHNPFY